MFLFNQTYFGQFCLVHWFFYNSVGGSGRTTWHGSWNIPVRFFVNVIIRASLTAVFRWNSLHLIESVHLLLQHFWQGLVSPWLLFLWRSLIDLILGRYAKAVVGRHFKPVLHLVDPRFCRPVMIRIWYLLWTFIWSGRDGVRQVDWTHFLIKNLRQLVFSTIQSVNGVCWLYFYGLILKGMVVIISRKNFFNCVKFVILFLVIILHWLLFEFEVFVEVNLIALIWIFHWMFINCQVFEFIVGTAS